MTTQTLETTLTTAGTAPVDYKLEVAILPVSDADRAKRFYASLGWREDADFGIREDLRILQLTPPGSPASIIFGTGVSTAAPGSALNLLAVTDIEAAHADLVARGVDVSEIFHGAPSAFDRSGTAPRISGPDPERASYASFVEFSDPDGNTWLLQELTDRLPGR
jgi:catechol 2,3-dioxygenase-like lactoylglutathione lyase family enzyme